MTRVRLLPEAEEELWGCRVGLRNFSKPSSESVRWLISPFSMRLDRISQLRIIRRINQRFLGGMAQPKLYQRTLNSIMVPFPPLRPQQVIVEKLDEIAGGKYPILKSYQQKLTAMAELRQSLLHEALSGELTADKEAPIAILKEDEVA